jgi:hypothetical protein
VKVIRHHAERMNKEIKSSADAICFDKPGKMVGTITKDVLTPVASASDVIERTGEFESERPNHLCNLAG